MVNEVLPRPGPALKLAVPSPKLRSYQTTYWLVLVMVMVLPVLKLLLLRVNDGIGLGVYNTMFEILALLVDPLAPLAALPL